MCTPGCIFDGWAVNLPNSFKTFMYFIFLTTGILYMSGDHYILFLLKKVGLKALKMFLTML